MLLTILKKYICGEKKARLSDTFLFHECFLNTCFGWGTGARNTAMNKIKACCHGFTFYPQIYQEKWPQIVSPGCLDCLPPSQSPPPNPEMWKWLHLPFSMANKRKWKRQNVCPHSESRTGEGHLSQQGRRGGTCPQPGDDLRIHRRGCCEAASSGRRVLSGLRNLREISKCPQSCMWESYPSTARELKLPGNGHLNVPILDQSIKTPLLLL